MYYNNKNIEIRSEEVQEVMNDIPSWIIQWGILAIFILMVFFIIGIRFIKYPDTIQAEVIINTIDPPIRVIAQTTGRIDTIYVANGANVKKNQTLAIIQNTASFNDITHLKNAISKWEQLDNKNNDIEFFFPKNLSLGTIQYAYATFLSCWIKYLSYTENNYYKLKIRHQIQAIAYQENYLEQLREEYILTKNQLDLSKNIFLRDSLLFFKNVISKDEYEIAYNNYLKQQQNVLVVSRMINQQIIQLNNGQEILLDIQQEIIKTENLCKIDLDNTLQSLKTAIQEWEDRYIIKTPISGKIDFLGILNKNQHIISGDEIFIINPEKQYISIATAKLPIKGAGKVQIGQQVNIRINNFPDQEFGYLRGVVSNISNAPTKEHYYIVNIRFPAGFITNYNIKLPISQEMHGNADIITQDLRLFDRIFMPINKLIKD